MNLLKLFEEIRRESSRIYSDARLIILEDLPFYRKIRIILADKLFIEIRINSRNKRMSYALVKDDQRIAGFDNLDGWHLHPFEDPEAHQKIKAPSPQKVLRYFKEIISKKDSR